MMISRLAANLILLLFAGAAFAAEGSVAVARVEREKSVPHDKISPPVIIEKYEYYDVCGYCEEELQCDLKKKCVTWTDGNKYDSLTSWDIEWDHKFDQDSTTCAVSSFRPIINFTFRYPRWIRTDSAPKTLTEKWDKYIDNLVAHETGHRDMVVAAVNDLSRVVVNLPPEPTCADVDKSVRSLFRKSMRKMKQDQREYDEATKHGTTQGAVFP